MDSNIAQSSIRQSPLRPLLGWMRDLFFAAGVLILGYCAAVFINGWVSQRYESRRFDNALKLSTQPSAAGSPEISLSATRDLTRSPSSPGDLLGRIEINRIGLEAMIMEGTDETTLRKAVGHIPGTALPGESGNIAMAGHRDTFFRALRNIRKDDEITLTSLSGSKRYQVDSTMVVEPEDTEVLNDSNSDILTLVTCYPFNFLGSAPKRFIVRAHRISG